MDTPWTVMADTRAQFVPWEDTLVNTDKVPVVVIGTGPIGKEALLGVINHPDLELVGVGVSSTDKEGKDAGELCGMAPVGVMATRDWKSLTALTPRCMAYFADGAMRTAEAVEDIRYALSSGINVVTTSLLGMIYPQAATEDVRGPLEQGCRDGSSTFWGTGIDPGFGTTQFPLALLSVADRIDAIRLYELGDISTYPVGWIMHDVYGYGQPMDFESPLLSSGILKDWWRGTVEEVAHAVGVTIDELTFDYDVAETTTGVETAWGHVDPGTIGAIRFQVNALVGDRPFVTLEHVDRVDPHAAPHWRSPVEAESISYRVEIDGRPAYRAEVSFDREPGYEPGAAATAMHAVNAIPAVVAAAPGVLGFQDLPPFYGKNAQPAKIRIS